MPLKRRPKHRASKYGTNRPLGQRDSIVRTNKLFELFVHLAEKIFDGQKAGRISEGVISSFLAQVLHGVDGVAAALYSIDGDVIRVAGEYAYPKRFRHLLVQYRLRDSHLKKVVRRKKAVVTAFENEKIFPPQSGLPARFRSLPIVEIPVLDGRRVAGVVELVGVSLAGLGGMEELFFEKLSRFSLPLLHAFSEKKSRLIESPLYEPIIEGMADGVVIVRDLRILYVNAALRSMFGYDSAAPLLNKSIETIIAPEDRERVIERSRSRSEGKNVPSRYEYKAMRKNGTLFDVEVVVSAVPYEGGQAVVALHRDITLKRAIEKELQQSEQMFRNVIDGVLTVGDALVLTNLEGKVLQVNNEFERLTGIKKSDAIGKEFPYEWLLDEEMARYVLWIKELREKKSLRDFDIHWKDTGGKMISVSMNTTLLYNALNRPVAMMNMARDISERKNLEEINRLQLERLRVLYELSRTLTSLLKINEIADAVYRHLVEVLPFDAFFIDLFEETTGTVRNIICYDTINEKKVKVQPDKGESAIRPGTGIAKVIEARQSLLENREADSPEPVRHPFGDKGRRSLSLLYIPMFSREKTIGVLSIQSYTPNLYKESHIRLLESFANLAAIAFEKAKLYEETISKSIQLQNRNKELDDFTYVVSHDLKEPLITVEGYSRILLKDHVQDKNSAASEYIQSIIQSCSRMKGLIDDLLVLSRVSRFSELTETVSLNDVINEVLDDLKFSIQEKRAEIVAPRGEFSYQCNPTQIKLVLRNLISNGIKFNSDERPFVKITIEENEKRVLISVQDNGIGIEKKFFDKIFVIFQRLNTDHEGSGAGLAIVKKIVELYQGQIWLESEIGKGTTFYVSLPK